MESVKIDDPRTWVRYRRGLCNDCWASCCHGMPVEASVPDLIRLGLLTPDEASTALLDAAQRLQEQGLVATFRSRSLVFVLQQQKSGDCVFLGADRRCTVYEKRPEICRQFPKIGPKPGSCPYRQKEATA